MLQRTIGYIQDICCFGKCSMTVGLPALSALGHTVVPLPTGLYSTHLGYEGHTKLDTSRELERIIAHYEKLKISFDALISGFLSSPEEAAIALRARGLLKAGGLAIVDPVMGDNGKPYSSVDKSMISSVKTLCAGADLITPNITEARMLLNLPQSENVTEEEARRLLPALKAELNVSAAVITGCEIADGIIATISLDADDVCTVSNETKYGGRWHGCGDLFVATVSGLLLKGRRLNQACAFAASFISECVRLTESHGLPEAEGLEFEPLLGRLCAEGGEAK